MGNVKNIESRYFCSFSTLLKRGFPSNPPISWARRTRVHIDYPMCARFCAKKMPDFTSTFVHKLDTLYGDHTSRFTHRKLQLVRSPRAKLGLEIIRPDHFSRLFYTNYAQIKRGEGDDREHEC